MTLNMVSDHIKEDPCEAQTIMATGIQCISMRRILKLGHICQTYNVDLCHTDENLSTYMTIQCGSMLGLIQILHLNLGKAMSA